LNRARGRIVVVVGAKGGVGTTAVAANLAAALSLQGRALAASMPGCSGEDLCLWLAPGRVPGPGARALVEDGTAELVSQEAYPAADNLFLLAREPDGGAWNPDKVSRFAGLAAACFPDVVFDAGPWREDWRQGALGGLVAAASLVLVVFDPGPVSLRRARRAVESLVSSGRPVRCALNRVAGRPTDSLKNLGELAVIAAITESVEMAGSILRGSPVCIAGPKTVSAGEFTALAAAVSGFAPFTAGTAPVTAADEAVYRTPAFRSLKKRLHTRFLDRMREQGGGVSGEVKGELYRLLDESGLPDSTPGFRERLLKELEDAVQGFGPLQDLLEDPEVSEVMVNGPEAIFTERRGKLHRENRTLDGEDELRGIIERIVAPLGRRIDESSPLVDARLPDGSRVNAVIPPLALKGSCLTIRKFPARRLVAGDLVTGGSLSQQSAGFLQAAVEGKLNILISGGTGSGKTTVLNILSSFIGPAERVVTIEDAAELKLTQEHVVTLEARPPNLEGKGAVTIRDLLKNSLRMRPDRIVVGEVRGGEALDMLQAMNTGHEGSLSTLHANTPRDALSRLETMVMMAGMDLPLRAIRDQVASAVDLVVQIARMKDGTRKVTHITEICGMEGEVYRMQDIYIRKGDGAPLAFTGLLPRVAEKLAERGTKLEAGMLG
jgi:pilus assembly protein CpaF